MEKQVFTDFGLRFNLRQRKQEKPTILYAVFVWNGKQYKVNTSVKVYPSQWDNRTQLATISNKQSRLDNRNNQITNHTISIIIDSFKLNIKRLCEKIDETDLVNEIRHIINPNIKNRKMDNNQTITFVLNYVAEKYESNNLKQYKGCVNRFEKSINSNNLENDISNLNGDLLSDYQDFLIKEGKQYKTINSYLKNLITLIKLANQERNFLKIKIDYSSFKMIKDIRNDEQRKSKQFSLTEDQLLNIYNLKGLTPKQAEARDLFLCQTLLGQRISDMPKIFKGEYKVYDVGNGHNTISFRVQKTKEQANIYLFPVAKQIVEQYRITGFKFFDLFNIKSKARLEEMFNNTIKEVGKVAGLNDDIEYTIQVGRELKIENKPQYELLHSHISRHTFITLMCKMGVSKEAVIIATAHTDIKMINEVYLHETAQDRGKKLVNELIEKGSGSELFSITPNSHEINVLKSLFDYEGVLRLNEIQKNCIDINELEDSKKVLESIKHFSTITPNSNIKKDEIDRLLTNVFPTLLIICDLPTLSLLIKIIAMNDISNEISKGNKDAIINSLENIYEPPVIFNETSFKIQHSIIQEIVIEYFFYRQINEIDSIHAILNLIIDKLK